jgi:hypothetical protein
VFLLFSLGPENPCLPQMLCGIDTPVSVTVRPVQPRLCVYVPQKPQFLCCYLARKHEVTFVTRLACDEIVTSPDTDIGHLPWIHPF